MNGKKVLILIISILVSYPCFAIEEPAEAQEEWRYYVSIKTIEQWLGRDREKLNLNAQLGAQQDAIKYELDIRHDHPWSYGFDAVKGSFYQTKRKRTVLLANFYYEMPLIDKFAFNPFIGAGVHHAKIIKHAVKLNSEKTPNTQEYSYKTKAKNGLVYNVGAEASYAFTDNVYGSLGWGMEEFLNSKLSGKRYNEQKVYLKVGYCFK